MTDSTIRVMLSSDLPTLVPPYFCTTQGTESSAELRSRSSGEDLLVEPDTGAIVFTMGPFLTPRGLQTDDRVEEKTRLS